MCSHFKELALLNCFVHIYGKVALAKGRKFSHILDFNFKNIRK
jgi:phosphoribosylaminoimidazole carboxylase (NCAIR synthetase)